MNEFYANVFEFGHMFKGTEREKKTYVNVLTLNRFVIRLKPFSITNSKTTANTS